MPLKLTLKPGEKFVINGAVVANGDRRATIVVQNKASILREKDILQPENVDSPAKRIYFPIMMMYLEGAKTGAHYDDFALRMTEFMGALRNPDALAVCVAVSKDVMSGEYYKALMKCRKLIEYEKTRLEYVSEGLPADADRHGDAA
ncbi:MAG: flagellar biosynthesis repressor FlbT [Parvularculaceae bacterium]